MAYTVAFAGKGGTGKTTIVNCFELLKTLALRESHFKKKIDGSRYTNQFDYLIMLGKNCGSIDYSFLITYNNEKYKLIYRLVLNKNNTFMRIASEEISISLIKDNGIKNFPNLKYDYLNPTIEKLYDGINHRDSTKSEDLSSTKSVETINSRISLESQLLSCIETGKSMIFSERNIDFLIKNNDSKASLIGHLIKELGQQITMNLFIYDKSADALNQIGLGSVFGIYKNDFETALNQYRCLDQKILLEQIVI